MKHLLSTLMVLIAFGILATASPALARPEGEFNRIGPVEPGATSMTKGRISTVQQFTATFYCHLVLSPLIYQGAGLVSRYQAGLYVGKCGWGL